MAAKNIRTRKLRSWLTMIGIFIGILSIVALIGLGEGLRVAITSQFGNFAPDLISIKTGGGGGPPGTGQIIPFDSSTINKIENLKEIKLAAGRNIKFGKAEFNNNVAFVASAGFPDGKRRSLVEYAVNIQAEDGRLLKDGDSGKIMIGSNLADKDKFGKAVNVGSKMKINDKDFEIVGILKKQGSFTIDGSVFMNDKDQRAAFNIPSDEYSLIGARFDSSVYTVKEAQDAVEKMLRKIRDVKSGEENFEVSSPQQTIQTLNSTIFAVQLFVYIIASISILVGGIGIMSTMYTTVLERTKEIGIMKSIGARNSTIFMLFFIESGFIGLAGGIIGVALGVAAAKGLAALGQLFLGSNLIQASIGLPLVLGALFFSFLLGSLFGTFPAIRAAKMKPVDALSYVK